MTLQELRQKLKKSRLDAYLVSRGNQFIGQDTLEDENQILKLSGFSGSSGSLLISREKAFLFVDGRYDIQARLETDPKEIEVVPQGLKKWLSAQSKKLKIGYNPWCHTIKTIEKLNDSADKVSFVESELLPQKLSAKQVRIFDHPVKFAGLSSREKIALITKKIIENGADAYITTAADSVSWLMNLRSDCLPNSPVIRAYAVITKKGEVTVFGDGFIPMAEFEKHLKKLKKKKVRFCFYQTPQKILNLAKKYKLDYDSEIDPCQVEKAVKNPVEISGVRQAHIHDGVALCKLLYWLEKNPKNQTELSVVEKLAALRREQPHFYSDSFGTIAGFGPDSAIVHYQPSAQSSRKLTPGSLLLLDSGGQYFNGTTDVTRTVAVGKPSGEMAEAFTYVLKSHIALASTVFLKNTSGQTLDVIARRELWKHGMEYAHGTGHGIGCFLNVHEGPNSISSNGTRHRLTAGMLTSIEPGYYKEGAFGIRIENVYRIREYNEKFLEFETLTLAPIDRRLIDKNLLDKDEIAWLDAYHREVYKKLEKHLGKDEKSWLKTAAAPL